MRRGLLVALAAFALLAPTVHAAESDVLVDDEGELAAGTGPVGIGSLDATAQNVSVRLPQISHAVHAFETTCERGLSATVTWSSVTNATADVPEHAHLQVELRWTNGTVIASSFDSDGKVKVGTNLLEPADFELHVFHWAGDPVTYHALVKGLGSQYC